MHAQAGRVPIGGQIILKSFNGRLYRNIVPKEDVGSDRVGGLSLTLFWRGSDCPSVSEDLISLFQVVLLNRIKIN